MNFGRIAEFRDKLSERVESSPCVKQIERARQVIMDETLAGKMTPTYEVSSSTAIVATSFTENPECTSSQRPISERCHKVWQIAQVYLGVGIIVANSETLI